MSCSSSSYPPAVPISGFRLEESRTPADRQFSEGMLGPSLFELDLKTSILCIIFFTAISCFPPAYCATNGPRTGMRQMVQARYALGYWPALICGFLNCLQFIGFMALTVILGGQSLSLASSSTMSWTVGIIVVSIMSLLVSQLDSPPAFSFPLAKLIPTSLSSHPSWIFIVLALDFSDASYGLRIVCKSPSQADYSYRSSACARCTTSHWRPSRSF